MALTNLTDYVSFPFSVILLIIYIQILKPQNVFKYETLKHVVIYEDFSW